MSYIPINIKTNYELLSSLIKLDDLICFAKENNISALSITDSNMFGTIEFYNKCKENNIKPIIGIDININNLKFILYAKNFKGYQNLCKIVSERNLSNLNIEYINLNSENLICVTNISSYKGVSKICTETYIIYKNADEKKEALMLTNKIVFGNEMLYIKEDEKEYLEYLYMIRDGETIYNHKEYNLCSNSYLKNVLEEDKITTESFVNLINIEFPIFTFELPKYSDNSKDLLIALCKKGLLKRLNNNVTEKYKKRLFYEISVIEKMGFIDYFLIVYDYVLYSKKNNIVVGPGRGSAAASLVSYSLGITNVDPLEYDLIFERFLNPERITMPDIDIDFEYLRRDEVIEYVRNKYGKDRVANIITFGTLLPKQVIRDVGRILEMENKKVDYICKKIPDKESFKDILSKKEFLELYNDSTYKKLFDISMHLENLKRHTSIHAAGIVMSPNPLTEKMPLYKSGDNILTAYTMDYMESLGLLKMDFLALRNLTIIDNVVKLINDKNLILNNIPLYDKDALKIFEDVNVVGIFQFESTGMKNFLKEMKISSFEDISHAIALYRPGPKDMIPLYLKRKKGLEKVVYIVPELESILKSTYGIIIYQEQILEILRKIGSFSYAEADIIRRAMSKRKENIIIKYREEFIKRSIQNGLTNEKANIIYNLILKFAGYGFNKAHSVAYSLIAYQMAYLKAHYTKEFMISILNMVIGRESKIKEYLDESKVLGLKFNNVNINKSDYYFKCEDEIYYPFSLIKGLGEAIINEIINSRGNKEFSDIYDFFSRIAVGKSIIEILIDSGALDIFGYNRKTLKENIDELLNYSSLCADLDSSLVLKPELIIYEEYDKSYLINKELSLYGFYINNHPVSKYNRNEFRIVNVSSYFDKFIESYFLVDSIKTINTKNGDKMAFLVLSDETGTIEGVLFPKDYEKYNNIEKGFVIKGYVKIERRMDKYQIIINKLEVMK